MEYEIDIHGLSCPEAKKTLEKFLSSCPPRLSCSGDPWVSCGEIPCKKMVRHQLKHPRILRKILTSNQGETILFLS